MSLLSTLSEFTTYVSTVLRPFILPILYHVSHLCLSLLPSFLYSRCFRYPLSFIIPFLFFPSLSLSLPIISSFSSSPTLPPNRRILPLSSFFPYCLSSPLPSLI